MKTKIFLIGMLFAGMAVLSSCENTDPQEMGGKSIPELCDQIINMPLEDAREVLEKNGFVDVYDIEYSEGVNYHFEREVQTMDLDIREGVVAVVSGEQLYDEGEYKDAFQRYKNWSGHGWKSWSAKRESWEAYMAPDPETTQYYYEGENEYTLAEYPLRRKDYESDLDHYETIDATHETIYCRGTGADRDINQVNVYFFTDREIYWGDEASEIGRYRYMIAYGVISNLGARIACP